MDKMIWLAPLFAAAALLFALYKARYVSKCDAGNSRMQEIAAAIAEGASAFLRAEYKILAIFIVVLFVLITIFIDFGTAVCFVIGACFSILAGFFGMRVATKANVRTANAKKYIEGGHNGGKGSDAHKAAVVGDTVGDPFKDTSGPSINILIKLMTVVSLVFAPLFIQIGGLL